MAQAGSTKNTVESDKCGQECPWIIDSMHYLQDGAPKRGLVNVACSCFRLFELLGDVMGDDVFTLSHLGHVSSPHGADEWLGNYVHSVCMAQHSAMATSWKAAALVCPGG